MYHGFRCVEVREVRKKSWSLGAAVPKKTLSFEASGERNPCCTRRTAYGLYVDSGQSKPDTSTLLLLHSPDCDTWSPRQGSSLATPRFQLDSKD